MTVKKNEMQIEGIALSEGIAIAKPVFSSADLEAVPEFAIERSEVSNEVQRYKDAINSSKRELQHMHVHMQNEGATEVSGIIETHIQMLDDPNITDVVVEKITFMEQNSESVFMHVIDQYRARFFKNMDEERAQECFQDVKDLSKRILRHLNPTKEEEEIDGYECIRVDYEVIPTKACEVDKDLTLGFIATIGGYMSHSALICRAKNIPFVSGIDSNFLKNIDSEIIIDGYQGIVILYPEESTLQKYREGNFEQKSDQEIEEINQPHGSEFNVQANIESVEDTFLLEKYNIDTVGLIRTEFLFLQKAVTTLSLSFQFEKYKEMVQNCGNAELTFRLFDIGSDKKIMSTEQVEPNPALGIRSLRFLMKYPEIFSLQVKALFLASTFGKIRIMLPLVTDYDELIQALHFIENCRKKASIIHGSEIERVPVGCMVEVPSFALLAPHFAKVCDFFSIGTNDLLQYTLAMDRICPSNESSFRIYHPAILQLIDLTVKAAEKEGIEVSICGEEASITKYTKLIAGLGIKKFSCSLSYVNSLRKEISTIDLQEAKEFSQKALSMKSANDVLEMIEESTIG